MNKTDPEHVFWVGLLLQFFLSLLFIMIDINKS